MSRTIRYSGICTSSLPSLLCLCSFLHTTSTSAILHPNHHTTTPLHPKYKPNTPSPHTNPSNPSKWSPPPEPSPAAPVSSSAEPVSPQPLLSSSSSQVSKSVSPPKPRNGVRVGTVGSRNMRGLNIIITRSWSRD
jgi:hypothetical protein